MLVGQLSSVALLARRFQTAPPTFQFVKNVYKKINYEAPFQSDEKATVLAR